MKSNPVLLLLAAFLFSLGSCTKELSRESPVQQAQGPGNFYATIDGQIWEADSVQISIVDDSGIVTITGISKSQEEISMVLPGFLIGVYAVSGESPGYSLYASLQGSAVDPFLSNGSTDVTKAGGTVSLTAIDTVNHTVSGTFQFKVYRSSDMTTKTVTAGVFNKIPYINSSSLPPITPPAGQNSDTLIASVNNVSWVAALVQPSDQSGMLVIAGTSSDGQQTLGLFMPSSVIAGTYTLDLNAGTYLASYSPDPLTFFVAQGNGSLTIISNDTVNRRITGRFNFVGISQATNGSANITNGYFSVSY